MTRDPDKYAQTISEFSQQLSVWGGDEAMIAFQRFTQTTYLAAPPAVMMRHYVEFVLAARRDLGYAGTALTGEYILGVRIRDYYPGEFIRNAMDAPLERVYKDNKWSAPWT